MFVGCSAIQPMIRFQEGEPLNERPAVFNRLFDQPAQVDAKIKLKAPGLIGIANGIVRHANNEQYMIELYGRDELFLKVYFTGTQTILWPASGMPKFFASDSTPTLKQSVHQLLPDWRLDDVLPVPISNRVDLSGTQWVSDRGTCFTERTQRQNYDTLYKSYKKPSGDSTFPFQLVTLSTESGDSRLTWLLK